MAPNSTPTCVSCKSWCIWMSFCCYCFLFICSSVCLWRTSIDFFDSEAPVLKCSIGYWIEWVVGKDFSTAASNKIQRLWHQFSIDFVYLLLRLKLGAFAYQYEFELSVHLRNVTRKTNQHKCYSLFHHFPVLHLAKLFLVLLGTVRFSACHCKSVQIFFIVSHIDTPQNKFAHTQTYAKYLSSFVHHILPKVLSKEEKEAPKLCFSPSPVSTYLSDKSFPDLKGLFACFEKDIFFQPVLLKLLFSYLQLHNPIHKLLPW